MKIIDVTLRDGGFVNNFNWNFEQAKSHIETMQKLNIHIIEVGYWKQYSKSQNPFYSLNEEYLRELTKNINKTSLLAVMTDFHYCSRNVLDYPKKNDGIIDLIRLTSRKQDFKDACEFIKKIKIETNLDISFQIINSTNYSEQELYYVVNELVNLGSIDIIAFADSHGNLNMMTDYQRYKSSIDLIEKNGIKWGFHLHNHSGRANLNYWILKNMGCNYMDASVNGLGKGGGNLHLEEIINNEYIAILLDYMVNTSDKNLRISRETAYNMLTARGNVTDNYREIGMVKKLDFQNFKIEIDKLRGIDRDTYNKEAF